MFKEQAEEKRKSMEALKAEVTTGKSMTPESAGDIDAVGIAAAIEAKGSQPRRRKKQANKGKAKAEPVTQTRRESTARRRGRPAGKSKKKTEYADQRTSLSFTPSELEKLDQFAHDHYARRKGAILLAIDLAERYEALAERGLLDDEYEDE